MYMTISMKLDEPLIAEALRIGQHRSKRAAIEHALKEYVQRHRQLDIINLFGTVDYSHGWDYKKLRRRK